jgi:hypothetical protein
MSTFALLKDGEAFVVDDHPTVKKMVAGFASDFLEVYNANDDEWNAGPTSTPWDLCGHVRILIRDGSISDARSAELGMLKEIEDIKKPIGTSTATTTTTAPAPLLTVPSFSTNSNPAPSLKRKASSQLVPTVVKTPRTTADSNVHVKSLADYKPKLVKKPHTRLIKDNVSDSFLLRLTFSQVAGAMELMKKLVVGNGATMEDAFHHVFSGKGVIYKRGTFNRHRDIYFTARPTIIERWSTTEGNRKWKEFYAKKDQYLGSENRWYENSHSEDEDHNDEGNEDDEDSMEMDNVIVKEEEVEVMLNKKEKGKGLAQPRTAAWKDLITKASTSTTTASSSIRHNAKKTGTYEENGVIYLSDSDSSSLT